MKALVLYFLMQLLFEPSLSEKEKIISIRNFQRFHFLKVSIEDDILIVPVGIDLNQPYSEFQPKIFLNPNERKKANEKLAIFEENNEAISLNFSFYYSIKARNTLGFSPNVPEDKEEFSLVHTLYNSGAISNKQFALTFDGKENSFHFGGIPENYVKKTPILKKCKTNEGGYWGCYLRGFGEYNFTSTYILFNSTERRIIVPYDFLEKIKSSYFSYYFSNNECTYVETNKEYNIVCFCFRVRAFTDIKLTFEGNVTISLSYKELFEEVDNRCYFRIFGGTKKDKEKIFSFGIPILNDRNILFDYLDHSVTFYYSKVYSKAVGLVNYYQRLFCIFMIINSLGICVILLYKFNE